MARRILIGAFCLALSGCSSLVGVDRSLVNHAAMDRESKATPARVSYLTGLGNLSQGGAGGACTTCAH